MSQVVLEGKNIVRDYHVPGSMFAKARTVHAVKGVSFSVEEGKTLAIVGESGCGKSTLARIITLIDPATSGDLIIDGVKIDIAKKALTPELRRKVQIVFQNPYGSLNPRQKIGDVLAEPLRINTAMPAAERRDLAMQMLKKVGLEEKHYNRYPHMFSGGQRQRIAIARALITKPALIVADEPVSALDVSVQAQVLLVLKQLRERRGLSFLFVSHDLSVVRWFCDRVAVMYLGRIVEEGPAGRVLAEPLHPYATMLREASPVPDPTQRGVLPRIVGEIPSAANPPPGCAFHPRCPRAMDVCSKVAPRWTEAAGGGGVACHLHG